MATRVRGTFFSLSPIMDVFSRKSVGREVDPNESAEPAASVFRQAHRREEVRADAWVRQSDNGAPMKGATRGFMDGISRTSSRNSSHLEFIFAEGLHLGEAERQESRAAATHTLWQLAV
ncbi:hypothetical protein [Thiocystis minor]|uniref:hypothetical protein n=1 Tax=Thiocystis minor TaxID=61597 RepID=UPI001911C7CA|nr:hypothetical protein [Thiocystis minor]